MRCTVLFLLALQPLSHACAEQAAPLREFSAAYTIHNLTLKILDIGSYTAKLALVAPGRYKYDAHTRPAGMLTWFYKDKIDEQSDWQAQQATLRPLSYTYNRSGGSKQRQLTLNFDWKRGSVTTKVDGDRWRMPIPLGTLDKLTVQLALMHDLEAGKSNLEYTVADGGTLKSYRFRQMGKERLTTPAGNYDTIKLERLRGNNTRSTYLWCAPQLHYLPVRVDQHEEDDSKFSMILSRYSEP